MIWMPKMLNINNLIILFFLFTSTYTNMPSNSTCKSEYSIITLLPFHGMNIFNFMRAASKEVSRNATNCHEIWATSQAKIYSVFNDSERRYNLSSQHSDYSIEFFESLTIMLYSEALHLKRNECLRDKGIYNNETGICVKDKHTKLSTASLRMLLFVRTTGNLTSILTLLLLLTILIMFEELKSIPGRYMLHLCVILLTGQTLRLVSSASERNETICALLGISIHWAYLTVFFLMCMIAVNTTRTFCQPLILSRYEQTRRYKLAIKAAYGFPIILTTPCLIMHLVSPNKVNYGGGGNCFITNVWASLLTFVVPIGCILLVNCLCLTSVVCRIHRANKENTRILRTKMSLNKFRIQALVLMIKLGTFSGIGWIFGFLAAITQLTVLAWIFELLSAFQGFGVFCSYICSVRVYNLLLQKLNRYNRTKPARPSFAKRFANSNTTQMWIAENGPEITQYNAHLCNIYGTCT